MPITAVEWPAAEAKFTSNIYQTTLNGALLAGAVAGAVNDAMPAGSPQAFGFQVDGEIFSVTATSGTGNKTWVIAGAQEGTAPAAHSNGAAVFTSLSNAAGFMGGDQQISVDLGGSPPRVLWMFDDPLWALGSGRVRSGFPAGHQILAIQSGSYDLSACTLTWFPYFDFWARFASFFPDHADSDGVPNYRWAGQGILLSGKLIIIGTKVVSGGVLDQVNGSWAVMIDNPTADPSSWNWFPIPIWTAQTYGTGDPAFSFQSLVDGGDGWVYCWAGSGPRTYAARFKRASMVAGDMRNPQWWCGTLGWNYESRHIRKQQVAPLNTYTLEQSTQHKRAGDGRWQLTGTDDGVHMQYAVMPSGGPGGSWPAMSNLFVCPNVGQQLNYAGMAHPEQTFAGQASNDVVVAYTPGFARSIPLCPLTYLPKIWKVQGI